MIACQLQLRFKKLTIVHNPDSHTRSPEMTSPFDRVHVTCYSYFIETVCLPCFFCTIFVRYSKLWPMAALRWMMQIKGIPAGQRKGAAVLNHKPTEVLRLSTSNQISSHKPVTWSLRQKLAAG